MVMELINKTTYRIVDTPGRDLWDSFVQAHPSGNFFQHPDMFQLYNSTSSIKAYVIAVEDQYNQLCGVLLYSIFQENGSKKLFSRRSVISGGPLALNNDPYIIQFLLSDYERRIAGSGIIYTEIRNHTDTGSIRFVFEKKGYEFDDHLNIYIDLTQSREDLLSGVHKKRMANIKRVIRKGIYSRMLIDDKEIAIGYELIKKTYQRVNLPPPPSDLFLTATHSFSNVVRMYGAFSQEKMIGSRVYLLFKDTVYDWYAGSDEEYFHLHPNDLLPWDMIRIGKQEQFKIYDFGGAGHPAKPYGVRTYKQRFGGFTINRGRYRKIHRPVMYTLGQFAIKYYKYFRHL